MSKPNTKCRVCGKEYFCCSDSKGINSWHTMACSKECFQKYLKRIEESRKHTEKINKETEINEIPETHSIRQKKKPVPSKEIIENII